MLLLALDLPLSSFIPKGPGVCGHESHSSPGAHGTPLPAQAGNSPPKVYYKAFQVSNRMGQQLSAVGRVLCLLTRRFLLCSANRVTQAGFLLLHFATCSKKCGHRVHDERKWEETIFLALTHKKKL